MSALVFHRIGIFLREDDRVMTQACQPLIQHLLSQSLQVSCNLPLAFAPTVSCRQVGEFIEHCDLVIAMGGDGTLLTLSRAMAGSHLPIVGVNMGRLGFLADVTLHECIEQIDHILHGAFRSDDRFLLSAALPSHPDPYCALNDVVIHAHDRLNMIEFETHINGRFLHSQRADGLVVSTPTGSTAYAMSAGGPILDVDLDALVLVSVCPHTLSNRPLVIAASSEITISLSETNRTTAMVTCDGRESQILKPGESVVIRRHLRSIRLLHPTDHDHYSILRAKLEWGRKLTC